VNKRDQMKSDNTKWKNILLGTNKKTYYNKLASNGPLKPLCNPHLPKLFRSALSKLLLAENYF